VVPMISLMIGFCSVWNTSPRAVIANALRYRLFEGKDSIITNAHNSRMIYGLVREQFDLLDFFYYVDIYFILFVCIQV